MGKIPALTRDSQKTKGSAVMSNAIDAERKGILAETVLPDQDHRQRHLHHKGTK